MTPNSNATIYGACQVGDIETIKNFLNSNSSNAGFTARKDMMLMHAVKHDQIKLINFMLETFKLSHNEKKIIPNVANFAISNNKLKVFESIIENFFNDESLIDTLEKGKTLRIASSIGNLDAIKYILNNDNLKKYVNIHVNDDAIFREAFEAKQKHVLHYFIFDLNIEITSNIKNMIDIDSEIAHMFELRSINKDLNNDLNNNSSILKKLKV
jgi:hypothetical protein